MRENLFRGKIKDNGEWIEGYFAMTNPVDMPARHRKSKAVMFPTDAEINWWEKYFYNAVEVLPETVGQFTGLIDCYGEKIFEGDIVKGHNSLHKDRLIYRVVYEANGFYYMDEDDVSWHPDNVEKVEVIGNIHDDPELLEEGQNGTLDNL